MAYYYILALDEREYGPLDLPTLKQWLLDYRVTPGTILIDANTRITTTLGDVLQETDSAFLANANELAFWASHHLCLNCRQALHTDAKVCPKCGILASPQTDSTATGRTLGSIFMMVAGALMLVLGLPLMIVVLVFLLLMHR